MRTGYIAALFFLLLGVSQNAGAQKITYDIDFSYLFDNREFDAGGTRYRYSETVSAAVLSPWVGLDFRQGSSSHRLMLGAEFLKDTGSEAKTDYWRETMFYWQSRIPLRRGGHFTGTAGIYPRAFQKGDYSQVLISDDTRFYDRNLEGMLLQWDKTSFNAELGLDWMGRKSEYTRERFQVFSAGEWRSSDVLSLGWNFSFFHLACSDLIDGVIDNTVVIPYVKAGFASMTPFDELYARLSVMGAYQWDRNLEGAPSLPVGGELTLCARKWDVEIKNNIYVGGNMMTHYNRYGNLNNQGDPFYNQYDSELCVYDRLDICYRKDVKNWLAVKAGASFYAGGGSYLGCSQMASVVFNLGGLSR